MLAVAIVRIRLARDWWCGLTGRQGGAGKTITKWLTNAARCAKLLLLVATAATKVYSYRVLKRPTGRNHETKFGVDLRKFEVLLWSSWFRPRDILDILSAKTTPKGAEKKVEIRVDRGRVKVIHYELGTG